MSPCLAISMGAGMGGVRWRVGQGNRAARKCSVRAGAAKGTNVRPSSPPRRLTGPVQVAGTPGPFIWTLFSAMIYGCIPRDSGRNGLVAAHFFFRGRMLSPARGRTAGAMRGDVRYVRIDELLEMTLPPMGFELVDLEMSPRGRLVRVFIDKPAVGTEGAGVTVEDCARVSNHLTHLFTVENIDYDRLEVSSPGLDRPLKKLRRLRALRRRGGAGQPARADRRRAPLERHFARRGGRQRPPRNRDRRADDPVRRDRPLPPGTEDRVEKSEMNRELLLLVDALAREKNVPKEIVFVALESALASATKKRFPTQEIDARVSIDRETGDYDSFRRWTVVPDEEHEEPAHQLAITDAAGARPRAQAGRRRRGAAGADRVRPHRRAGGEAGDPAEDPRRRARADPERLPRARGQPADRARSSGSSAATSSSSRAASKA